MASVLATKGIAGEAGPRSAVDPVAIELMKIAVAALAGFLAQGLASLGGISVSPVGACSTTVW
jgi:hypothetical protein